MKTLHQKSKTCLLIIVTLIGIVWGCKKTERLAIPPPPAITVTASVAGNVSDLNNAPVSGALVAAGASTTTTDANGQFTLRDIQLYKDAGFVKVTKAGYFTGSRTFLVNGNTTNNIKIQLIPKTISGTITSSSGGNVDVTGGVKINFTAGSFVNAAGNTAYTGDVAVAGYYLNPADANFREYMPGDLRGVSTTNKEGILKSFGMLSVEMNETGGQKLQLAEGKTATISIPIPSALQAAAPATISLWYFDETKGIWNEEGTATKLSTNYVGIVSHFSFWNAGEQGARVQLDATLKWDSTAGLALINKLVTITSVNFGTTKGYTDNNGKLSGLVPANENLVMKVFDTCSAPVYSKNIGPFSANTYLGTIAVVSNCSSNNPPPSGKTILIDASKDGGVWWFPQVGPFSSTDNHQGKNLADYLRSLGYYVDELGRGTVVTSAILNNYTNVIRCGGYRNYTADELAAYESFLSRSTSLLLLQDHLANFTNDQLSAQLGLNFEGVQGGTITSFAQHEVTTGVSSFPYMEGSYIKNPDASKITVIGSLQLSSGENYCVMGIVKHPNANIFFIGDVNGLEQTPQPFTSNLTDWLFR